MKVFTTILLAFFIAQTSYAQIPLSKRDQAKKAEFEAQIAAEKKYDELMIKADRAFISKDYVEARMSYNEAIEYNKEKEQWLVSKVNDLDILMAKIIMREVDSILVIEQKSVDQLKNIVRLESEIASRDEPMVMVMPKPIEEEEEVPVILVEKAPENEVEQMPELEEPIVEEPNRIVAPEPTSKPAVIAAPVNKEVKVKEDFSRYPQGRSDETFTFPDHSVRRIIIKDGIDTIVYKYVTHRWGGKFYFKDDVSISERIWKGEILGFEKKYPTVSKLD